MPQQWNLHDAGGAIRRREHREVENWYDWLLAPEPTKIGGDDSTREDGEITNIFVINRNTGLQLFYNYIYIYKNLKPLWIIIKELHDISWSVYVCNTSKDLVIVDFTFTILVTNQVELKSTMTELWRYRTHLRSTKYYICCIHVWILFQQAYKLSYSFISI